MDGKKWKEKITTICLIKNEENWIWYALESIIDWVDQILIYDTGSTDRTVEIIKTIDNPKIVFEEKGKADPEQMVKLWQELLDKIKVGWVLLLGGDEIWPEKAIIKLRQTVENANSCVLGIGIRCWNCLGDVFHHDQEFAYRKYPYGPQMTTGWWIIKCFRRKIPGLHFRGLYGFEGLADYQGREIHQFPQNQLKFLKDRFFHTTHLKRSTKDKDVKDRLKKRRYKLGSPLDPKAELPEVFYQSRPRIVSSALEPFCLKDRLKSYYANPWYETRTFLWKLLILPRIKKALKQGVPDEKLAEISGIKLGKKK